LAHTSAAVTKSMPIIESLIVRMARSFHFNYGSFG